MMWGNAWNGANFNPGWMFGSWMTGFASLFGILLLPFIVWSLVWKGWALWIAAKKDSKAWFVVLLVLNTLGILEILYIFIFSKSKKTSRRK